MKTKINIRLVGIAILAVIATVIGVAVIFYGLFQKQIKSDLSVSTKLLKDTHFFESVNINLNEIDLLTDINELRITLIDKHGNILYDNDATTAELENHINRPEIKQAFSSGIGESVRKSDTMHKNTYYYAVLLDDGTVLRVATEAQSLGSVFLSVAPLISLIILIIIAVCIIISQLLTRQLLKPIETMVQNLENLDYESPYKELDRLVEILRKQHTDVLSAAKARQDFTANVSHELKTPLTAISGYAELLECNMVDEQQQKQFYKKIKNNSDRLLTLINDIIKLSELDTKNIESTFEEVDLYCLANDCINELYLFAQKRDISLLFSGEHTYVHGNRDMLKELIENLVQNAIRYNNIGGSVVVSVKNKDKRATLEVKDNGIGISESDQQRIFERFYRVDKSRSKETGGTGLGLAIVKHIVEIHDAEIRLNSTLGLGTTISILF